MIETAGENALIVLDDFPDGARALYPMLLQAYNNWIRVARHRNQGIFSLQHTYAGGKNTSQSLQSNKYIIFFPRSQQNRCITFLRDHLMMQVNEARAGAALRQAGPLAGNPDAQPRVPVQLQVPLPCE